MGDGDDDKKKGEGSSCPVNEWVRHILYAGGMIAMHTGVGAAAAVSGKSQKCPVSEWARHAVYTGGFVALCARAGMGTCKKIAADDGDKKWYSVCPLDEWGKHAVYVAGMVGLVALINSRKN